LTTLAGQSINQDIKLQPFCQLVFDDIESNTISFTADAPWAITTSQFNSPTSSWTDSPGSNYQANANNSLTSEVFSIEEALTVELGFAHYCDTESGFDLGRVETRINNGNWETLYQCSNQAFWEQQNLSIDLPAGAQTLQFRFRLTSDGFTNRDGWYIDDVSLRGAGEICRTVIDDVIFEDTFETVAKAQ